MLDRLTSRSQPSHQIGPAFSLRTHDLTSARENPSYLRRQGLISPCLPPLTLALILSLHCCPVETFQEAPKAWPGLTVSAAAPVSLMDACAVVLRYSYWDRLDRHRGEQFSGELRLVAIDFPARRHTGEQGCVSDSKAGRRCNLKANGQRSHAREHSMISC